MTAPTGIAVGGNACSATRSERVSIVAATSAEVGRSTAPERELDLERKKSERLLLNVLPASIATRLKRTEGVIADGFPDVTVLFADIVEFTRRSERIAPEQVVEVLNDLFSAFDRLARSGAGEDQDHR